MDLAKYNKYDSLTVNSGIIDFLYKQKSKLTFWQNIENKRIVYYGSLAKVDHKESKIHLNTLKNLPNLDFSKPIYIHGPVRGVVFKLEKFSFNNNILIFDYPKETHLNGHRVSQRISMVAKDIRSVYHQKEIGLPGCGKFKSYSLNCIEISEAGISLEIQAHHLTRYRVGDLIIIKDIAGTAISNLEAEIVHIGQINEERKTYRVGCAFSQALASDIIKRISNKS